MTDKQLAVMFRLLKSEVQRVQTDIEYYVRDRPQATAKDVEGYAGARLCLLEMQLKGCQELLEAE